MGERREPWIPIPFMKTDFVCSLIASAITADDAKTALNYKNMTAIAKSIHYLRRNDIWR